MVEKESVWTQQNEAMTTNLYLIILVILVIVLIFARLNIAKIKGERGEKKVRSILKKLPSGYHVLNDVVLEPDSGTTQIDHVVVSKFGVFAIESKNYGGDIYGNDNIQNWTQLFVNKVRYKRKWYKRYTYVTKNQFYNPVKQSLGHVYGIKKVLSDFPYLKVVPIVVFVGSADISHVNTKFHVIYKSDLMKTILGYDRVYMSDSEVSEVVSRLVQSDVRDIIDNKTHVRNIQTKKKEYNKKLDSGICPRCGGALIKREWKFGEFYGCSNYPKCKFTTRI